MQIVVQYKNEQERHDLINKYSHLYLTTEKNISEGNFLIFSDALEPEPKIVYKNITGEEMDNFKDKMNLLIQMQLEREGII